MLGGVAFLLLTHADVAVYVSALQRLGSCTKGDPCQETECPHQVGTSEPNMSRVQNVFVHGETGRLKPVFISACFQTQHVRRKYRQVTACEEQHIGYAQETLMKHLQIPLVLAH